jgi:hypothetical protein
MPPHCSHWRLGGWLHNGGLHVSEVFDVAQAKGLSLYGGCFSADFPVSAVDCQ